MVAAFIRERGVTVCPPHRVQHSGPSATGWETPDCFLFRESAAHRTPEQKLAAAKILQMLQDLGGASRCTPNERFKLRQDAERWFFRLSDFELWCESAGLAPEMVRIKARRVMEEGFIIPLSDKQKTWKEHNRAYRARRKQRDIQ